MVTLSYNKACNVEDFSDPSLRAVMRRELSHKVDLFGDDYPSGHEDRKDWETAMALRAFADHGLLDGRRELLGVGAGVEELIFCLTRHARRVFATDLYLEPGLWTTAQAAILRDPRQCFGEDWEPRRLVAQHMDALDLQYEDESFDGVFSSSSIEHFGGYDAVHRAMDEIFRVLRPGGIAAFTTELRLSGDAPGMPGTLLFDGAELQEHVIGDRPWRLLSPLDLEVTETTMRTASNLDDLIAYQDEYAEKHGGGDTGPPGYPQYPVVALRTASGHVSTPVHLALRKKRRHPLGRLLPNGVRQRIRRRPS